MKGVGDTCVSIATSAINLKVLQANIGNEEHNVNIACCA